MQKIARLALTLTVAAAALLPSVAHADHFVAYVQTGTADPNHPRKQPGSDFGTDAQVSLVLQGSAGESQPIPLSTGRVTDFDAGSVDVFTFEAPSVGELKRLRIGHDHSGPAPDWYLDWVVIRNETTGKVLYFPYDDWLGQERSVRKSPSSTTLSPSPQPDPRTR